MPNTTLVCIDCRDINSALWSLSICARQIRFGEILFLTDKEVIITPGRVEKIGKISTIQQYSQFMFTQLHRYITTQSLLICQYDGFIINASAWSSEFLNYDYIGAPWKHHRTHNVGNGGFSFRSLKLHKILSEDIRFTAPHPEDGQMCRTYRNILECEYGINFAPTEVAAKFSVEAIGSRCSIEKQFGFHGRSCLSQARQMIRFACPQKVNGIYNICPQEKILML